MSWGAIAVGAGTAIAGYVSSSQQAKAANKKKTSETNQTTTQTPYGNDYFMDPNGGDVANLMTRQRALIEQGPNYIGGKGSGAPAGGGGGSRPAPPAGKRYNNAGKLVTAKNAGSGGGAGGAAAGPAGTNYNDPTSISAAVARAGLNAGNDPTTQAAGATLRNIMGSGNGPNGATGFENYNPINARLASQMGDEYSDDDTTALLHEFLNGGSGGGSSYDPYAPGGGGGSGGGYRGSSSGAVNHDRQMVSGGGVPDTMASDSYFSQQVRHLMDQGVDDESIQAIIDAQSADITRGTQASLWGLDAQAQGTGRLGGDAWKGMANDQVRGAAGEIGRFSASTRLGARAQQQAMQQNLLGQVNTRDLGAMQDATQRYGIDASASAASAGRGADAAATTRAQNLQALGMLLDNKNHTSTTLAGLGGQLSGDLLGAAGQAPGLAGVANAGLGQANNAAANDVALRGAQIQGGTARAALNQQAQIYNANAQQSQLDNYLRTMMGIGSMGGSSSTVGTNVQPGLGVSPTGAGLAGGIGAGLAGYGMYQQYHG